MTDDVIAAGTRRTMGFRDLLRRAKRDKDGATVVEFALVLPVFLALLFAIFEVGLLFFRQMLLDNALQEAARDILVGKTQADVAAGNAATVEQAFKTSICDGSLFFASNCSAVQMQVLIGTAEINANRDYRALINSSVNPPTVTIPAGQSFSPLPTASEDVVVRVFAPTNTIIARLNGIGLTMTNGGLMLVSSTAFRVEPFTP
jgi:Flp pilus assembly protein TadG